MIGYIPARSGSKRIPSKNQQYLCSFSLVELAIIRAHHSGLSPLYVSSDSQSLLDGISVTLPFIPLLRDLSASQDDSSISSSLISDLGSNIVDRSVPICVLQPSNPFCTIESIRDSSVSFCENSYPSLVSAYRLPYRHYEISSSISPSQKSIVPYSPINNFDALYFVDGNFVFTTIQHCLDWSTTWRASDSFVYIQNNKFIIDIDEPFQLVFAKACWSEWLSIHNQSHFYRFL
jgi:CMP-N,N'-diacetyllegionaminic acid synthase